MGKAVLLSIKPKYCELIASGKKTIEVRKTRPKMIDVPFKGYIYCTKPKKYYKISSCMMATDENLYLSNGKIKMSDGFEFWADGGEYERLNGKVIGEFLCDEIKEIRADNLVALYFNNPSEKTCLNDLEMRQYANGKNLFLWHISNLVIYDKPKELGEFRKSIDCHRGLQRDNCDGCWDCQITRAPQSWGYVEELV